jgi:aminopeptidase N
MPADYRFRREDVRLPPAQLRHMEIHLDFRADGVEGVNALTLAAREPLRALALDAQELEVRSVERLEGGRAVPTAFRADAAAHKLHVELAPSVPAGGTFALRTRTRCVPSATRLEGLYLDVTPPGAPPQILSQCQQWGFQRILPVIDDCTAKCTYRTTLEADARYTHLPSTCG